MTSLLQTSPTIFIVGGLLVLVYYLYCRALPQPIPGIPHNKYAAKNLLGDVPEFMKYVKDNQGESMSWWSKQCIKHNSPIVQLFLRPLGKPLVVVGDFREQQDIMMRRTKEFDRSQFFMDLFSGVAPTHHINMPTNDKMKAQKRLLAETMTPAFINEVAAPQIHKAMLDLVELWTMKSKLADGRPFAAAEDIAYATLDAIWVVTLDSVAGTTRSQTDFLKASSRLDIPEDKDQPVEFPHAPQPPAFEAVLTLTNSIEPLMTSPFPRLHHWFLRQGKRMQKAALYKNQEIEAMMEQAIEKFSDAHIESLEGQGRDRSAVDHLVRREILSARKEGREPQYNIPVARDELFGFLLAGHDTTATTVSWGVKLLCDNQVPQTRFREALREAYAEAAAEERQPTAHEVATIKHPYIDATLEEILRCSSTASGQGRMAMVDTEIFGYPIPKGTDVFFLANITFNTPPIPAGVDEQKRSASSRQAKDKTGIWEVSDIGVFKPERWLRTNDQGEVEYDHRAGPNIPFGLGVRGCFGKKMAYIQLRMLIVFIVWNFDLLPAPEELSGYRAIDRMTHQPRQCYVRAEPVTW